MCLYLFGIQTNISPNSPLKSLADSLFARSKSKQKMMLHISEFGSIVSLLAVPWPSSIFHWIGHSLQDSLHWFHRVRSCSLHLSILAQYWLHSPLLQLTLHLNRVPSKVAWPDCQRVWVSLSVSASEYVEFTTPSHFRGLSKGKFLDKRNLVLFVCL